MNVADVLMSIFGFKRVEAAARECCNSKGDKTMATPKKKIAKIVKKSVKSKAKSSNTKPSKK